MLMPLLSLMLVAADAGEPAIRAKAIGSVASWVTAKDYPPVALKLSMEGVVQATFTVDAAGRASDCRITGTSGYDLLDSLACALVIWRARYTPARNEAGDAVQDRKTLRYTFSLQDAR